MKLILPLLILLLVSIINVSYGARNPPPQPIDPNQIVVGFMAPTGDPEYSQYFGAAQMAVDTFRDEFKNLYNKTIVINNIADTNDIIDSLDLVYQPVNGVIGPAYSGTSAAACMVFGAFEIPNVSFYATGTSLSNPSLYPYFNRVMPDDLLQVKAILAFVKRNGWTRISCVHTNEDYGNGGAQVLIQESNANGITVNTNQAIEPVDGDVTASNSTYDVLFDNLEAAKARVIVTYALFPPDCQALWEHANRRGFIGEGFTWIVTDGCAELTAEFNPDYLGMVATFPYNGLRDEGYTEFEKTIVDLYSPVDQVFYKGATFSYDAAFSLLTGIKKVLQDGGDIWDGTQVRDAIRASDFIGKTGRVQFDPETGDRMSGYLSILNLINSTKGSFDYIGRVPSGTNSFIMEREVLYAGPTYNVPSDYQVIVFDRTLNIVLGVITGVCVLVVLGIGAVIVLQWRKFRYSSPLFCMFIIVGALMGLSSVFMLLSTPTIPLCSSFPWLLGLGYVILFGTLFTKTWRTWRLFSNARKFKVIRITNQYIITLVGAFVLLESVFMILWTAIDRQVPSAEPIFKAGEAQLQCTSDSQAWWFVFVFYKVFYILVGVFLAFKTRDVVDSLNESKPITLALYNLTFVMIVAIALGFILRDNPVAIIVIETIAILLGFTVTVAVLFLPKVWLILSGQQHSIDSIGASMDSMGRTTGTMDGGNQSARGYTNQDYNNQSIGRSFSASAQGFKDVKPSNNPTLGIVYTGGDNFPRVSSNTLASRSETEITVNPEVLNKVNNKNEESSSSKPEPSAEP